MCGSSPVIVTEAVDLCYSVTVSLVLLFGLFAGSCSHHVASNDRMTVLD